MGIYKNFLKYRHASLKQQQPQQQQQLALHFTYEYSQFQALAGFSCISLPAASILFIPFRSLNLFYWIHWCVHHLFTIFLYLIFFSSDFIFRSQPSGLIWQVICPVIYEYGAFVAISC